MLNKVMIIGRLGKDPEVRYAANGTPIANLNIATDESYVNGEGTKVERTEWHTVVVFQRQAENCKTYLAKGSLVFVEGSLQTRKWQDKQGQDRYSTEIKANRVQFLDRKGAGAGTGAGAAEDGYGGARPAPNQGGGKSGGSYNAGGSYSAGNSGGAGGYGGGNSGGGSAPGPYGGAEDLGPAFPSEASGMDDVPF